MKIGFLENIENLERLVDISNIDNVKRPDKQSLKHYDLILSANYVSPISNFLTIKAMQEGVKTAILADGLFEWGNAYSNSKIKKYKVNLHNPIMHDVFYCVGKVEEMYFNYLGYNAIQYEPKILNMNTTQIKQPNDNVFLITTANTPYFNDYEMDNLVLLIESVIDSLEILNFKYFFRIFDQELIKRLKIQKSRNFCEGGFSKALKKCDFVISTPSSIVVESMYHQRPVAQLIYRDSPHIMQSGWAIFNSNNTNKTLQSMIKKDNDRIEFQNFQVTQYKSDVNIFTETRQSSRNKKLKLLLDQHLFNMLNSSFNFNFEYLARKVYLKFKTTRIIKFLRGNLK
jgi:hypothetical protein